MLMRLWFCLLLLFLPAAAPDGLGAGGKDGFWHEWLSSRGRRPSRYPNVKDYADRTAPSAQLPRHLCDLMTSCSDDLNRPLRVLDVNAGPLSSIGTHCGSTRIELVPTDLLAPAFDATLDKVGLTPRTRTRFCPVEQLSKCFAPGWFDLATSFNALAHAQDPLEGMMGMLHVLRPRCSVVLVQKANESNKQGGLGMHQHNFFVNDGEFFVQRRNGGSVSINGALEQVATVKTNVSRHVDPLGGVTGNKFRFPFFSVTLIKLANSSQGVSSAGAKFDEAIRGQRQTQIVSSSLGESNTEVRQCKLLRKASLAPCELGRSFGCDFASGSMWVDGCRGWFRCASSGVHCGYPTGRKAYNCSCASAPKAVDFPVSLESTQAPRTHDLFNLQFPSVCHGRFMAVKDDLLGAGLGFTSIMLSRLMYVAVQKRRILIEVPATKPRWCNTPPQTLQCFYQPWTNCSLDQKGADVLNVSLKGYHRSRKWYGINKLLKSMQPNPAQFFFRPNALVQRHVNAVIAQCGGTDYWTVHVRDSPEKRAEMNKKHLPDLQGYVRRLPPNVTRILWQTANPAAFQAILRYSSQRPGLRFCYTNFSRHTEDVWGGRNASFTDESGLTGAVNGELGHLGTGLISLRSSMWTAFLADLNASMKVIAV